ncbi:MAG: SDR family NAD(P)-dependent oxidoreductase [Dehalococcoidia bacterium]
MTRPIATRPVCVISGASGGFGLPVAVQMAAAGFDLVLINQDRERGMRAVEAVRAEVPRARVVHKCVDLASMSQVRRAAEQIASEFATVDVLFHIAATAVPRRASTEDAFERTLAVNYLAPFLLTQLLHDPLRAARQARVVMFSSLAERASSIEFDDMAFERGYSAHDGYGRSKLALVLFANELGRRWAHDGVTANCMNPGSAPTQLLADLWAGGWRPGGRPVLWRYWGRRVRRWLRALPRVVRHPRRALHNLRSSRYERAAAVAVRLATDPALAGVSGTQFIDDREVPSSPQSQDPALAARLWDVTVEMLSDYLPVTAIAR